MKKGKITVTITIGLVCFVLVSVMFIQFKTVSNTDIASIKTMREADLRTEIANLKTKNEEIEKKYLETIQMRDEYLNNIENNQEATELLEKELNEANTILGLTDVTGKGIVITLEDNAEASITANDIILLLNELRLAGAEAISINDERIVNMSDVADVATEYIAINKQRLVSPYVVKAIGDQVYLESGLTAKQYGYMDSVIKPYGKTATIERQNKIKIFKYKGDMPLKNISEQ